MTLPYSRTVLVTLTRNDSFPARRGFGTPLILQNKTIAGKQDASNLTRLYSSMDEVAVDFTSTDDFYKAANQAFAQDPAPVAIKAGWYNSATVTTAALMKTALDGINDKDQDWYFITLGAVALRDSVMAQGIIEWTQARRKLAILDSNAIANETLGTGIAGTNKGLYDRTAIFYHTDATQWGGVALAATLSTYNFDEANAAYTAKYKKLEGIPALDKPSSVIQTLSGFVVQLGQATTTGNMANVQIDIGGQRFVVEGSTLVPNVFIDEIHATDWIVSRTEEEALGILLNNKRIPFTDAGMEMLASAARTVMKQAHRTGIIADDYNPETGLYEPAVEITVPSVFDVPESQRKARIAPEISVRFRYADAVHYVTIRYRMAF